MEVKERDKEPQRGIFVVMLEAEVKIIDWLSLFL